MNHQSVHKLRAIAKKQDFRSYCKIDKASFIFLEVNQPKK